MTLIMYRDGVLSADRSVKESHSAIKYRKEKKLYVSKDKVFAGVATGKLMEDDSWEEIRRILELWLMDKSLIGYEHKSKDTFGCIVLCIYNKQPYKLTVIDTTDHDKKIVDTEIKVAKLDINGSMADGSSDLVAQVLIDSGKKISTAKFYDYVSRIDQMVSQEFDFVKLEKMKGLNNG